MHTQLTDRKTEREKERKKGRKRELTHRAERMVMEKEHGPKASKQSQLREHS